MKSTKNCGVCGRALNYGTDEIQLRCEFCGDSYPALIYCPEGHYICDTCHSYPALKALRDVLNNTTSIDPSEILDKVMSHPSVPMHGPEHHAIVPGVIITAVKNAGYPVQEDAVEKAIERGSKIPGGWCGFYGACGAAIGVGITVSVLTAATPLTGKTRAIAIEATALALERIADGGPRCCKRASRKAIEIAVKFLKYKMDITLTEDNDISCRYVDRNQECLREDCAYFTENER